MYSRGLTRRPVSPTSIERGNNPSSTAARVPPMAPPSRLAVFEMSSTPSLFRMPLPPLTTTDAEARSRARERVSSWTFSTSLVLAREESSVRSIGIARACSSNRRIAPGRRSPAGPRRSEVRRCSGRSRGPCLRRRASLAPADPWLAIDRQIDTVERHACSQPEGEPWGEIQAPCRSVRRG